MHVELLGQLGQRLLALHGGEGHLRLEGRGVVPARSSRHRLSLPAAILAAVRQKLHSARLSRFPEPALKATDQGRPCRSIVNGITRSWPLMGQPAIMGV